MIATRCGGPETIVEPGTGLLVPVGDLEAIAAALGTMFEHARDHDAADIRRRTVERFGREAVVARLEAVYARVTGPAVPSRGSPCLVTTLISAPSTMKNAVRYIQVSRMMTAPMLP